MSDSVQILLDDADISGMVPVESIIINDNVNRRTTASISINDVLGTLTIHRAPNIF